VLLIFEVGFFECTLKKKHIFVDFSDGQGIQQTECKQQTKEGRIVQQEETITSATSHSYLLTHIHTHTHTHTYWDKLTASALMIFFPMQIACGSCSGSCPGILSCTRRAYEYIYLCIYLYECVCVWKSHTHIYLWLYVM